MSQATVRRALQSDEPALTVLAERVVDGGAVAFTARRRVPWLESAGPGSVGFVAESSTGEIVGTGWVRTGRCRLLGASHPYAMLHSLSVAPEVRRQGVATALTEARLAWVAAESERRGEAVIPMATIQQGNRASQANARRWVTTIAGELQVTPVPVRHRPPKTRPDWTVTTTLEPPPMNDDVGFGPDTAPEEVLAWLRHAVRGEPVNHLFVVADRSGTVRAALGIHDDTPVSQLHVARMPHSVALANRVVHVVAPDGSMRTGQVALAWNRDPAAGRYLWQHVRWLWRDRVTSLVTTVDPTDPFARMTRASRLLPATRITLGLRFADAPPLIPGPVRLPL